MEEGKFQEIAQNIFSMTCYDFEAKRFFDVDPQTKEKVTQEQKDMFLIVQENITLSQDLA